MLLSKNLKNAYQHIYVTYLCYLANVKNKTTNSKKLKFGYTKKLFYSFRAKKYEILHLDQQIVIMFDLILFQPL